MEEEIYSIAIRRRLNKDDRFWMHPDYVFKTCRIVKPDNYWLADPFLFEKNGETYIFYEAYDLVENKGKIGYSLYRDEETPIEVNIIIDQPYHMSFPYIFKIKDDIYIMPETSADYRLLIYKSKAFPYKWELSKVIMNDGYVCDSIILQTGEQNFLVANEMFHNTPSGEQKSCYIKTLIAPLKADLTIVGDSRLVLEGDFGIRNAGDIITIGNEKYRIGQDCTDNIYGKGLVLFKIESINPYKESMVWNLKASDVCTHIEGASKEKVIGCHTYNSSEHYEIIDYYQFKSVGRNVAFKRFLRNNRSRFARLLGLK